MIVEPTMPRVGNIGVIFSDTLSSTVSRVWSTATCYLLWHLRGTDIYLKRQAQLTTIDAYTATAQIKSAPGDLENAGYYLAEWRVQFANGDVITFPASGPDRFVVLRALELIQPGTVVTNLGTEEDPLSVLTLLSPSTGGTVDVTVNGSNGDAWFEFADSIVSVEDANGVSLWLKCVDNNVPVRVTLIGSPGNWVWFLTTTGTLPTGTIPYFAWFTNQSTGLPMKIQIKLDEGVGGYYFELI